MTNIQRLQNYVIKLKDNNLLYSRTSKEDTLDDIILEFSKRYSRLEKAIGRLELIKFIIRIKVLKLEDVKKIYEICNYPFDYENNLYDYYDIALKIFIENELYDGQLPDNAHFKYDKTQLIDDDISKYEIVLQNLIYRLYVEKDGKIGTEEENLLYNLCILEQGFYDTERNIFDLMYPDSLELTNLRSYFLEYDISGLGTSAPLYEDFIHVILLTILDNFYETRKTIKNFRRVISDIPRSIYKRSFMNKMFIEDLFSYNYYEAFYKKTFIDTDREVREKTLLNLFKTIFENLKNVQMPIGLSPEMTSKVKYAFFKLSCEEFENMFLQIKHSIDAKYLEEE